MSPGNRPRNGIRRPKKRTRPTTTMKPPTMMSSLPISGMNLSYRPHRVPSPLWGGTGRGSLEPDPADRLLDLCLVQARDRHAVDHGEGNVLDVDIEVAQVLPVELAVSADVFLECDASVLQDHVCADGKLDGKDLR